MGKEQGNRGEKRFKDYAVEILCGTVSGAFGGFFGAGGGVFVVILYKRVMKFSVREAHASAVATMLPAAIISSAVYIINGAADISLSVRTSVGSLTGGIFAGFILRRIKGKAISRIFGGIMIVTGVWLFIWR